MTGHGGKRAGAGRPPLEGGTEVLYVRLPAALAQRLDALVDARRAKAEEPGPRAEVLRGLIERWVRSEERAARRAKREEG